MMRGALISGRRRLWAQPIRRALLGLALLLPAALAPPPLRAAPAPQADDPANGAILVARALFGGWVDPGRWTAVTVEVETRDAEPGLYRLGLRPLGTSGSVVTDLELSPGGRKRLNLLLPVEQVGGQPVFLGRSEEDLAASGPVASVDLRDSAGRSLVVVASGADLDLSGLDGLGGPTQPAAVALERPGALPAETLAYSAVDHLVLADLSWTSLEPGQQEAIRRWVALGGHLLVAGGPSAARTLGSIPAAMRPAQVLSARQVPALNALGALAGTAPPVGPAAIAQLVPEDGAEALLSLEDGSPLALRGRFGDGRVTFLALDPFQRPLRGWDGRASLWQALAQDFPLPDTALSAPPARADDFANSMSRGEWQPFPVERLVYLLLAYLLLVGPLNYLVLRRRRRLDLAWLTIPALSLGTTGLTYAYGRHLYGGLLKVDEWSLVRVLPDAGVAHVSSVIAVFGPQGRGYSLEAAHGQLRVPAMQRGVDGATVTARGEGSRLEGLVLAQWSRGLLEAEAVIPWPTAPEQGLILEGSQVMAALRRPLGKDLDDAQLLVPGGYRFLGDWSGDLPRQVRVDYKAFEGSSVRQDDEDGSRRSPLLQALRRSLGGTLARDLPSGPLQLSLPSFKRPDALLLGWREEGALGLAAAGRASLSGLSLVHGRLPIALGLKSLRFINGTATERGPGSTACGPGAAAFSQQDTRAEFSFPLGMAKPPTGRLWLSLVHPLSTAEGFADLPYGEKAFPFTLSLWDGSQGQWLAFDRVYLGQSMEIPRVISRDQGMDQVRLRLEAYRDPVLDPELWDMFDGCVEPRLALQEGLSPSRGSEELLPVASATSGDGAASTSADAAKTPDAATSPRPPGQR